MDADKEYYKEAQNYENEQEELIRQDKNDEQ